MPATRKRFQHVMFFLLPSLPKFTPFFLSSSFFQVWTWSNASMGSFRVEQTRVWESPVGSLSPFRFYQQVHISCLDAWAASPGLWNLNGLHFRSRFFFFTLSLSLSHSLSWSLTKINGRHETCFTEATTIPPPGCRFLWERIKEVKRRGIVRKMKPAWSGLYW